MSPFRHYTNGEDPSPFMGLLKKLSFNAGQMNAITGGTTRLTGRTNVGEVTLTRVGDVDHVMVTPFADKELHYIVLSPDYLSQPAVYYEAIIPFESLAIYTDKTLKILENTDTGKKYYGIDYFYLNNNRFMIKLWDATDWGSSGNLNSRKADIRYELDIPPSVVGTQYSFYIKSSFLKSVGSNKLWVCCRPYKVPAQGEIRYVSLLVAPDHPYSIGSGQDDYRLITSEIKENAKKYVVSEHLLGYTRQSDSATNLDYDEITVGIKEFPFDEGKLAAELVAYGSSDKKWKHAYFYISPGLSDNWKIGLTKNDLVYKDWNIGDETLVSPSQATPIDAEYMYYSRYTGSYFPYLDDLYFSSSYHSYYEGTWFAGWYPWELGDLGVNAIYHGLWTNEEDGLQVEEYYNTPVAVVGTKDSGFGWEYNFDSIPETLHIDYQWVSFDGDLVAWSSLKQTNRTTSYPINNFPDVLPVEIVGPWNYLLPAEIDIGAGI